VLDEEEIEGAGVGERAAHDERVGDGPGRIGEAQGAGFGEETHLGQLAPAQPQLERVAVQPARVVRTGIPVQFAAARHFPFIGRIEVDANHVQVFVGAAQFRLGAARKHVPRFELAVALLEGGRLLAQSPDQVLVGKPVEAIAADLIAVGEVAGSLSEQDRGSSEQGATLKDDVKGVLREGGGSATVVVVSPAEEMSPAEAQAGKENLAQRAQVEDEAAPVEGGEAGRRLVAVVELAVRIILDDRHAVPRRQCEQRVPPREGHRHAGRVLMPFGVGIEKIGQRLHIAGLKRIVSATD